MKLTFLSNQHARLTEMLANIQTAQAEYDRLENERQDLLADMEEDPDPTIRHRLADIHAGQDLCKAQIKKFTTIMPALEANALLEATTQRRKIIKVFQDKLAWYEGKAADALAPFCASLEEAKKIIADHELHVCVPINKALRVYGSGLIHNPNTDTVLHHIGQVLKATEKFSNLFPWF
jgi:hypothetical protein